MAAWERIGIDAVRYGAVVKNCPQKIKFACRIGFGHDRQDSDVPEWLSELFGNCFSQFNIQICIIMACSFFNFEKLINLVHKYQFLYDESHKHYCNFMAIIFLGIPIL